MPNTEDSAPAAFKHLAQMSGKSAMLNSPPYVLDTFAPAHILGRHQWLNACDLTTVLGDDLDSVMCGVLMHHLRGWQVAGFYTDYKRVWHPGEVDPHSLQRAVWLDLDISRQNICSVGHHILLSRPTDNLACHRESVNPNLFRGVTGRPGGKGSNSDHGEACPCGGRTFPHKYPLGTIHFLLWLFSVEIANPDPFKTGLLWLPDSSWINGQSHKYRLNVLDWVRNWIRHQALVGTADLIDAEDFERTMRDDVFPAVQSTGFGRGKSQATSRHLKLGGHQCQFKDPNTQHTNIQALANLVASTFGWSPVQIPPPPYQALEGTRNPTKHTLASVRKKIGSLDQFIKGQRVFSYVIPNSGKINYTVGINL